MRSSKPRSRKNNRNRPQNGGNIPNRVFDSSGPEGKVRGTPQQIIDKYQQLARDAQLAGDRVAVEAFYQHSEHYLRMLGEAQKEIDARREQQERENRERQAERDRERAERDAQQRQQDANQPHAAQADAEQQSHEQSGAKRADGDVIESASSGDNGLVETPESKPRKPRAPRKPRKKPEAEPAASAVPVEQPASTDAAE